MAEPIRISALGREVRVGDVYNFFGDAIIPTGGVQVPNEIKLTPERVINYFYQQPDKFKSYMLGINSHLKNSIYQDAVHLDELWFANYLNPNPLEDDIAKIDVFIKVVQRTEFLDQHFIDSKLSEYKLNTGGLATHIVEQVVYGAEFICSVQKKFNRPETKESAEENLYRATKEYFDQIIKPNSVTTTLPIQFEGEVCCKIFSSLFKADDVIEDSFQQCISWLSNATNNLGKDHRPVPIEIFLRYIPEQIETRLQSEKLPDMRIDIEWNWNQILLESNKILKIARLDRVSPLAKVMNQFRVLLMPLLDNINAAISSPQQLLENFESIKKLLKAMTDWLAQQRKEIETICSLLDGTELVALDLEEIKTRTSTNGEKIAKCFVLKVEYNQNPLIESIQKIVGHQTSAYNLPFFSITKLPEKSFMEVRSKLNEFADEATHNCWGPNRDTSYYISLVPIYFLLDDGTIQTTEYFDTVANTKSLMTEDYPINSVKKPQQNQLDGFPPHSELSPPLTKTFVPTPNQQQLQTTTDNGPTTAAASPATISATSEGIHDNPHKQVPENQNQRTDFDEALSSDSESIKDGESNNKITASSNMVKIEENPLMQQESSGRITIESVKIDITRDADVEKDLFVKEVEQIRPKKVNDVADYVPSRTSTAVSIEKSSTAGRSLIDSRLSVNSRSASNDHTTHARQSDSESKESKHHATIWSNSSRQEEDKTAQDPERCFETSGSKVKDDDIKQEKDYSDGRNQLQNEDFSSNRKIAEIFSGKSGRYSRLIKEGQPNVYLLNAKKTSISEEFRWFDMGRYNNSTSPSNYQYPRDHKVIILMGATGCGKSTLINGMINYILGVQWKDPFRFKCVRDDETTDRNQALSQTSSVTAYTLHHQEGMTVPFSITIIDTPGYGDTRGIQRDKEITRNIHQFLTQQETRVNEIHAACFVAASGDSRLTATQRYIIDSVLSIFGKDVKPNMRLLVTFADNADPPVVEACLAANFPVTSGSVGITYSKFNSSVLYANNNQQGEDDFCFDELFWDMGQENFYKFFAMLENMNGRNLKSTREVIQRRHLLEQSLKDIEQELEVCLFNIENMEMFRRKMREFGHKMETTKNFVVEKTVMRNVKVDCDKGFKAYNCVKCKETCEPRIKKLFKKIHCTSNSCPCPDDLHEFQQFEWRKSKVIEKTTLLDMKAEYESNFQDKMTTEQLLVTCQNDIDMAKGKVLSLLEQVGINARSLDSTALRSNALSPADYLSLMRSRVAEEQAPGYLTRLETLTELQQRLTGLVPKRHSQLSATHGSLLEDMTSNSNFTSLRTAEDSVKKKDVTQNQLRGDQKEEHKRGTFEKLLNYISGK